MDWARGDLAVCVNAKPDKLDTNAGLLSEGRTYRVAAAGNRTVDGASALAFRCLRDPTNPKFGYAFSVERFRKIRPADDEFIALIAECKPVRIES